MSRFKLILGSLIGIILYPIIIVFLFTVTSSMWEAISGLSVEPPMIGFMSDYSKPAQNGYWIFVWSSILTAVLFSAFLPSLLGASIGKYIIGVRYVDEHGNKIRLKQTLLKTMYSIALFLLVALPGPIMGFSMGKGSEYLSLAALFLGIIGCLYFLLRRDASNRTLIYVKSGIVPIHKQKLEEFKRHILELNER